MKNIIIVLLFSVGLLWNGCSSDPTSPVDEDPPPPSADSKTIGSGGGTLTTDNFELIVPPGAFASSQEITLSNITSDASGFNSVISKELKLDGLPQSFSKPLKVKIKYTGSISDSAYIAIGEETWVNSLDNTVMSYHLVSTVDSSGYLEAIIPASDAALNKMGSNSGTAVDTRTINLLAIAGYASYISKQGHFLIKFPSSVINETYDLANYLEEAYAKFNSSSFGFSYKKRSKWPVAVTVKDLRKAGTTVYGYSINSTWGDNYGYMEFNFYEMGNAKNMRITAGHEFFHLVQNLYDPRNRFAKAISPGANYWLFEAASVWSEEFFSTTKPYTSSIFESNAELPLLGAEASVGKTKEQEAYGYGMSSFLKFLSNKYGDNIIAKIYQEIQNGSSPFNAINKSIPSTASLLWNEFIKNYLSFDIYKGDSFNPSWLQGNPVKRLFHIDDESDTLKTFSYTYSDLSAAASAVINRFNNLDPAAQLVFDAPGNADNQILLFKVKQTESVYLKQGHNSVTLDNFKSITDAGYIIVAVVTDNRCDAPYSHQNPVDLTIHVRSGQTHTYYSPYFLITFKATLRDSTASGDSFIRNTDFTSQQYWNHNATISKNTLTFVLDTLQVNNYHIQDTLVITVDNINNPTNITDFKYSWSTFYSDAGGTETQKVSVHGTNIPLTQSTIYYNHYEVIGNITSNVLQVKYHYTYDNAGLAAHNVTDLIGLDGSNGKIAITYAIK